MNFISEKIENAEDIKYFNSFGFQDSTGKELTPSWWVIDRTSGVFLFSCGRSTFGLPQKYGLCIDKELVKIEALSTTEGDRLKSTLIAHWMISKIEIPISLIKRGYVEEDIVYMIEQAFTALGLFGMDWKDIANVFVQITVSPQIMKEESKKEEREVLLKKKDDPFGCGSFIISFIAIVVFSNKVSVALDISGRSADYLIILVVVSLCWIINIIRNWIIDTIRNKK
ncbi:MAG: hypothetical protein K2L07_09475 [Lachnospiraceae bacterium]|nr:hypothetical protein [Lachnospiraceae bacterium]